ncbi:TetR/AcrR family transcriptional regulator [Frankia gtarii]|uniref:TetR/AcrR family transcriptional regulator n=1 Tax=Frankia gtarii TaxID=2950102 RepID=UPI0021C1AAA9|nr:TetR family transcriptional regulator [Frankia gtarii]
MTDAPAAAVPTADGYQTLPWSPNQQAVRLRIAHAAARLVAREGLSACTIRSVAEESELKKSTVHYYVRDSNELVDLAVLTLLQQLADQMKARMDEAPDGPEALCVLVRMFMGRGAHTVTLSEPTPLKNPMLWSDYTTHAWSRGAGAAVVTCFDTFGALFEAALARCEVAGGAERARAIHLYLLGAVQRNILSPLPPAEVAWAVSALAEVRLDPGRC